MHGLVQGLYPNEALVPKVQNGSPNMELEQLLSAGCSCFSRSNIRDNALRRLVFFLDFTPCPSILT